MLKQSARTTFCLAFIALCTTAATVPLSEMVHHVIAARTGGKVVEAEYLASQLIRAAEKNNADDTVLAWALDTLGSLKQDQSSYQDAQGLYERSIRLWRMRSESLGLAHALNDLASLYSDIDQFHKSELLCRKSLTIRIRLLGTNDPDVAMGYPNLATVLFLEGCFRKAELFAHKALNLETLRTSAQSCRRSIQYDGSSAVASAQVCASSGLC